MPEEASVSVFSFTNRISSAKLKKYYDSTSRGMAASNSHAKKSGDMADSTPVMEPPAKKPRLKLNGPRRHSDDSGESIAVAQPQRKKDKNIRFRYSDAMKMTDEDRNAALSATAKDESLQLAASPAPSSGLSSLSSATPSEKETSPFVDPAPSSNQQDYGDFMSYYVDDDDKEPDAISKPKAAMKTTAKAVSKVAPKAASKPSKPAPKPKALKAPAPAAQPPMPIPAPRLQTQQPHPPHAKTLQQGSGQSPRQHCAPPQPHPLPGSSRLQHGSPAYDSSFPQMRPSMQGPPHQRAAPIPHPIVQFSAIDHPPRPDTPDTVAQQIKKLHDLSRALTTFGAAYPGPDASPSPPPTPGWVETDAAIPLDNFLSFFADDDANIMDRVLDKPGTLDGPLTHGIIFIQNALKSWAQQRVSLNYTNQYNERLNIHQQNNAAKRGPGRPRKFDEPTHLLPPSPVIQLDLASTPEGEAIKAFQAVLDSECLRVNVRLPAALASALRRLYMQIDLLINQGEQAPPVDWQCMSYGAQISAQHDQVERWKAHLQKVAELTERQQMIAHQNMMAQLGLPGQQQRMSAEQAEHAHAVELETRRSQAHAHQQPYIRQQHLNPLQLGPRPPGPPGSFVPSQPLNSNMKPSSNGPPGGQSKVHMPLLPHGAPVHHPSPSPGVQLDKMKMYVPGYLPLSGQSMKYSFAPQTDIPVQVPGSNAFLSTQGPTAALHTRMPLSAPPAPAASRPPVDLTATPQPGLRSATAPIDPDAMAIDHTTAPRRTIVPPPVVQSLTPVENTKPVSTGNFRAHQRPQTPVVATHGFTAVNASAARTSSVVNDSPMDTSPETIKVASKKPAGSAVSAKASRGSNKRSASGMNGQKENTTMPSKFPHPGAIVLDD